MPGVTTLTATRPGASSVAEAPASTFFVAGITERGDNVRPVLVRSMAEYLTQFGSRVNYGSVYDALDAFFNEEGTHAYVARVVGAAATSGTLALLDRAGAGGVATLRIDAKNPGAWSSRVSVAVDDAPTPNAVKVTILLDGVAAEVFNNLADPAAAAAAITAGSQYVNATNLGSVTAAPANNPAVVAATALSAGTDDRASVTAAIVAAAVVARFPADLGPGIVATPGYDAGAVGPTLLPDALAKNRLVALAPPVGSTAAQVRANVQPLRALAGAECAGVFYPWVTQPDGAGGVRTVSPEGFVAGVRARTQVSTGPWQAPAGSWGVARFVAGPAQLVDRTTGDALNDDGVSCIRVVAGQTRLYGWRSLSPDQANYRFLTARDVMNYVAGLANVALEEFTFGNVDSSGHLYDAIATEVRGIVQPVASAGGLYARYDGAGNLVDPGFRIDTGPAVNTPPDVAAGRVKAVCAVRPSPVGELIILTISRVSLNQAT